MTEPDREERDKSVGLYVDWDELRRRVAPGLGRDRFRALVKLKIAEAGFPPFRDSWGGFYWPKVEQWLDSDNEVGAHERSVFVDDGPEHFDAAPRKKARVQNRAQQSAVLDRESGDARSDGLPGNVHPLTRGRER